MSKPCGVIVGLAVGIAVLAVFIILWFVKSLCNKLKLSNKNTQKTSSDPSALESNEEGTSAPESDKAVKQDSPQAVKYTMEELEQATKQFSESNLIGVGTFGSVHKGLLHDCAVAIKRRSNAPKEKFVTEVLSLSRIRHNNLVSLLGYCQERGSQMLVYEYIPNGNMHNHLFDKEIESSIRLKFKQRLLIALGAAKGLCHLHKTPLVHKNFKMANVLVDENFVVKVSDAGISNLIEIIEEAGPSRSSGVQAFQDPEARVFGSFNETNDIYSFGVFLMELLTGKEAAHMSFLHSGGSLLQWVDEKMKADELVDKRLTGSFTEEGMRELVNLILNCLSFPGTGRPNMKRIVNELERIHEREISLTTLSGGVTAAFLKGSDLFT